MSFYTQAISMKCRKVSGDVGTEMSGRRFRFRLMYSLNLEKAAVRTAQFFCGVSPYFVTIL